MENFEIGDRVVYLDTFVGRLGTVAGYEGMSVEIKWDKGGRTFVGCRCVNLQLIKKSQHEIRVILHTGCGDVTTSFPEKCLNEARSLIDSYYADKKNFSVEF